MKYIIIICLLISASSLHANEINLNGTWTGQAQFQATIGTEVVQSAHSVNTFMLKIEPHGKVTGASKENGCKLLGVAAPGIAPYMLKLDVTISECSYKDYNYRYSGRLVFYENRGDADFMVQFNKIISGKPPEKAEIKATLFRQK